MTFEAQLQQVKEKYPEVWEYMKHIREQGESDGFHQAMTAELPTFDDNDEVIHYQGGHA